MIFQHSALPEQAGKHLFWCVSSLWRTGVLVFQGFGGGGCGGHPPPLERKGDGAAPPPFPEEIGEADPFLLFEWVWQVQPATFRDRSLNAFDLSYTPGDGAHPRGGSSPRVVALRGIEPLTPCL